MSLPKKSWNVTGEIGFGISFKAILLSGTSSLVCDIDEKILRKKNKNRNFAIFWFINIKNKNLTHEKQK